MNRKILLLITMALCTAVPHGEAESSEERQANETRWDVTLDTSSLEIILLHPEDILADPDAFWKTDDAYILAKKWHNNNHIPLDTRDYYNGWLAFLKDIAEIPEAERRQHEAFQLLEALRSRVNIFQEKSIPLLDSFVPINKLRFKTTLFVTGKTLPYAFMTNSMIVIDVLSSKFGSDPDKIFNSLTHECYHIGYGYNRYLRKEIELENGFVYNTMLDALQNEGLAVYVGYCAHSFFPAQGEKDYEMLDDESEVKRHLNAINTLFAEAETLAVDLLRPRAWEIGVTQRGYYVLGAHMARTIDTQQGRKALLATIEQGPLNFVDEYNRLAAPEMKVHTFERPRKLSLYGQLKIVVLENDKTSFERISAEMQDEAATPSPEMQQRIERLGYGMIYREAYQWAIEVFKIDVALFPQSANAWDCLAEAYMKNGDRSRAIRNYEKALRIDPGSENAAKMLSELKGE